MWTLVDVNQLCKVSKSWYSVAIFKLYSSVAFDIGNPAEVEAFVASVSAGSNFPLYCTRSLTLDNTSEDEGMDGDKTSMVLALIELFLKNVLTTFRYVVKL